MITDDAGLRQALDQLAQLYGALAQMRQQHKGASPQWRALLQAGHIDHIRQLRQEIENYVGVPAVGEESAPEVEITTGPASILQVLLAALQARPFRPFRLRLADGTSLEVRQPGLALPTSKTVVIGVDGTGQVPDRAVTVALGNIIRVEPLEVPAA